MSFSSAFASARKAGKKEFTWNGKQYNTKLADTKTPAKAPTPTRNPNAAKSSTASKGTGGNPKKAPTSGTSTASRGSGSNPKPKSTSATSTASKGSGSNPKPKRDDIAAAGKTSRLPKKESKLPSSAPTPTSRRSVSKNVLGFEVDPRKKYRLR